MQFTKTTKVAVATVGGALLLGGGAVAWAQASPSRPAVVVAANDPTTSTTTPNGQAPAGQPPAKGRRPLAMLRGAVHGTLTVKDQNGQWIEVTFDRGEVTAVSAQSITIKRADAPDKPVTIAITSDTKYRGVDGAANVQVGKQAIVVSKDAKALTIGQPGAAMGMGNGQGRGNAWGHMEHGNGNNGNGNGNQPTPSTTAG